MSSKSALGKLVWEIAEAPAWRTAFSGNLEIMEGDIQVIPPGSHTQNLESRGDPSSGAVPAIFNFYLKQLQLDGGFLVELVSKPTSPRMDLIGFGLRGRRTVTITSSWEWYCLSGDAHARHLQQPSELAVRIAEGPRGSEIAYTEFLSDAVLRIYSKAPGCLLGIIVPPSEIYRIRILRGSYINWPPAS